jgi:hypothetical protein
MNDLINVPLCSQKRSSRSKLDKNEQVKSSVAPARDSLSTGELDAASIEMVRCSLKRTSNDEPSSRTINEQH